MSKKSKNYKEVVEILKENRISPMSGVSPRDSDTELLIQFLQIHLHADLNARQLELIRSVNFESITRCRRKLQEGGEYLPSPEVARKRRLKGYDVTIMAEDATAEELHEAIA